jgi:hypothetical protein
MALHHLDNLNAQVDRINSLLAARRGQDGDWTYYHLLLEHALYLAQAEPTENSVDDLNRNP